MSPRISFAELCAANPDFRFELDSRGECRVMTPASSGSGRRNQLLSQRLGVWAEANELGITFDSSAGFALPNGAIRSPDASWVARGRWDLLTPEEREGFAPLCPDFVAELRSASDRLPALREKMAEYIGQGARLGWLIDPTRHIVEVYRPGRDPETVNDPATLPGEDVLPGFVLDLKDIL